MADLSHGPHPALTVVALVTAVGLVTVVRVRRRRAHRARLALARKITARTGLQVVNPQELRLTSAAQRVTLADVHVQLWCALTHDPQTGHLHLDIPGLRVVTA